MYKIIECLWFFFVTCISPILVGFCVHKKEYGVATGYFVFWLMSILGAIYLKIATLVGR